MFGVTLFLSHFFVNFEHFSSCNNNTARLTASSQQQQRVASYSVIVPHLSLSSPDIMSYEFVVRTLQYYYYHHLKYWSKTTNIQRKFGCVISHTSD